MAIQCPSCGSGNRDIARFCKKCGEPLAQPQTRCSVPSSSDSVLVSQPPDEAMVHFNWAKGMILGIEDDDRSGWREPANELSLAVEKAGGVFPAAHAFLGLAMTMLGNTRKARREFNLAIQQEDCNVMARAMLLLLDLDSLGTPNLPLVGAWTDLFVLGIGAAATRGKLTRLRTQIDDLGKAFRESIRRSDNVKDWISASELMLQVHDAVQEVADPSQTNRLAQEVLDASWDTIEIPADLEQEVADICRRAEAWADVAR